MNLDSSAIVDELSSELASLVNSFNTLYNDLDSLEKANMGYYVLNHDIDFIYVLDSISSSDYFSGKITSLLDKITVYSTIAPNIEWEDIMSEFYPKLGVVIDNPVIIALDPCRTCINNAMNNFNIAARECVIDLLTGAIGWFGPSISPGGLGSFTRCMAKAHMALNDALTGPCMILCN